MWKALFMKLNLNSTVDPVASKAKSIGDLLVEGREFISERRKI